MQITPRWLECKLEVLTSGFIDPKGFTLEAIATFVLCRPYMLVSGRLYKQGSHETLQLCLNLEDHEQVMQIACIILGGFHVSGKQTTLIAS